jgi:serine phosphatase RsbU (regulator of sigma subunit)
MTDPPGPAEHDPLDLLQEPLATRLADRLVAAAQTAAGAPAALYVIDLEGRCLRRVAGAEDLPAELEVEQLVGPELPAHRADELQEALGAAAVVPLQLRGRALAVLAFTRPPEGELGRLATHGAAAIELAERYTDVFARGRRRQTTNAAGELQQELMPPRIMHVANAQIVGTILPAYSVGGDWIDTCATPEGAWLGVADAVGKGVQAEAIGAIGLAAYRAVRRSDGPTLARAATAIHETIGALGIEEIFASAILASWEGSSRTFTWLRCGHPAPMLWHPERGLQELEGGDGPVLGLSRLPPGSTTASVTVEPGTAVVLITDGILERTAPAGERFGHEGLLRALRNAASASPTAVVTAVLDAVRAVDDGPLRDDASVLVLGPDGVV